MEKIILISIPVEDLQAIISNCVNSCLKNRPIEQSQISGELPLTIQEAAKFLNLAVPTLYALVGKRALPYSKKGKRLYFSEKDLVEWIKSGRRKTAEEIGKDALKGLTFKREGRS